ncbi:MAG: HAMP domain-containing sensor histidine kinase [Candidatus Saccharibacteria bacterium]|nr:HAMP domain-containing sensor histidine kinase [Candidatus Saccharibacteria bacterium]
MFKKLRNRIVGISMASTTVVLIIAFSVIYSVVSTSVANRPMPKAEWENSNNSGTVTTNSEEFENGQVMKEIRKHINEDRENALKTLLISLIITGVCVEFLVFILVLFLADQSIKPVKETYEAQKQFIANASHEIKTPLAVIQANLEASEITDNIWINNAAEKAEELAELNGQLLALARVEAGTNENDEKSEVELKALMKKLTTPLKPQIDKKGIKLTLKGEETKKLSLNLSALKQILNILLDNAIKYSDKKITVSVSERKVIVKNDGTTIEKEKLPHLFERFYQVDKTKSGVGLGLAIASEVATKNGWKLSADSDNKSTSFILNL